MRCSIYREQIKENPHSIPPETKIHIEDCYDCKKLYNECLKFEKFMRIVKENLLQNIQPTTQPQQLISLAFIKKAIQKNLATMKRLYIYATIILVIFIYTLLINTFTDIKSTPSAKNSAIKTHTVEYVEDEEDANFLEELEKDDEEFINDTLQFFDSYI
jgi:hypothetical protein